MTDVDDFSWKHLLLSVNTPGRIGLEMASLIYIDDKRGKFRELVDEALRYSISLMARDKNIIKGMNEDQLTIALLRVLIGMGFDASHDTNNGGHCDIFIKGPENTVWLGEAKIHSSYGYLYAGFQQLVDRYSTGTEDQDVCGLVIYVFGRNCLKVMEDWMSYLISSYEGLSGTLDGASMMGKSTSPHIGTGRQMLVTHYPVPLYHNPTDVQSPPKRPKKEVKAATAEAKAAAG